MSAAIEIVRAKGDETETVARAVYEHPLAVRLCHWFTAVSLFVRAGSGLQIFRAFPSFGAKIPQKDLLHWPKAFAIGGWLGGALQPIRHHYFFGPKPPQRHATTPHTNLAYTTVIGLGVLSVLTGLAVWKPVQFSWLAWMMGGFHLARLWHFLVMWAMIGFVFGHLVMVILHGWNNFMAMLTGWKKDPEYPLN